MEVARSSAGSAGASESILGEASEGAVEAPSELETNELRDPLAVICRVAEGELRRLGALEIQVQVVLPREADAAVELDPGRRDLAIRVGGVRLRHGHGEGCLWGALVHRPGREGGQRLRVLDVYGHFCRFVLYAVVGPDRL